ncbi:hypothetical protein FGO68_gene13582 [Halteria grandinella]|uniref:Uncharacterized protein n=1 Tax=Halteria grandinella TaxID=5974 RepID=A0A8J8T8T9_HALGN|nr:hypothetical protein FGO68_gene13582 [Halteria grandinella]
MCAAVGRPRSPGNSAVCPLRDRRRAGSISCRPLTVFCLRPKLGTRSLGRKSASTYWASRPPPNPRISRPSFLPLGKQWCHALAP